MNLQLWNFATTPKIHYALSEKRLQKEAERDSCSFVSLFCFRIEFEKESEKKEIHTHTTTFEFTNVNSFEINKNVKIKTNQLSLSLGFISAANERKRKAAINWQRLSVLLVLWCSFVLWLGCWCISHCVDFKSCSYLSKTIRNGDVVLSIFSSVVVCFSNFFFLSISLVVAFLLLFRSNFTM